MIFAKNCMFKGIERIFTVTFALLVATLLPVFGIAVAHCVLSGNLVVFA